MKRTGEKFSTFLNLRHFSTNTRLRKTSGGVSLAKFRRNLEASIFPTMIKLRGKS